MNPTELVRLSKFLSKHLRHDPAGLGLTLAPGGWVGVDALLAACAKKGVRITAERLEQIVAENDKQRFSFDQTRTRIRANQGHSTPVDLQLAPTAPPTQLFHGTGANNVEQIRREGIQKRTRYHVHLSPDRETATQVGARHGKPVVLVIDAGRMHTDGHLFYVSENGVWLTDHVPPTYLA